MDFITPTVLIDAGATVLLAVFVLAILRGRLVPRSVVQQIERDRDATLARIERERDMWQQIGLTALGQNDQLLVSARAATDVLRALPTDGGDKP